MENNIDVKYENDIISASSDTNLQQELIDIFNDTVQVFNKHKKALLLKPAFENLLKINGIPQSIKLLSCFFNIMPMMIPWLSNIKSEDQKSREADDVLLKNISDKIRTVWVESRKMAWRYTISILEIIPQLNSYFPIHDYNEYYLDEAFLVLKNGNLQTKPAAALCLCELLLNNHYAAKRKSVYEKIQNLGNSASFYERTSFLYFCKYAVQKFSLELIKELGFIEILIKIGNDKVSNMRIRFLENIKEIIINLNEIMQNSLLKQIKELQNDKNKDVQKIAYKILDLIQKELENNEEIQNKIEEQEAQKIAHEKNLLLIVFFLVYIGKRKKKKENYKMHYQRSYLGLRKLKRD